MKIFHFKKFVFQGKPYSFKVNASNIKEALMKAVNWGMKKHNLPKEYFGDEFRMAKENLEKGFNVVEVHREPSQLKFNFEHKFEEIYRGLINEEIRGEWWIDESGSSWFADGDIGDVNHSNMVIQNVTGGILSLFDNTDTIDEPGMLDEYFDKIKENIMEDIPEHEYEEFEEEWENDPEDVIRKYLEEMGVENVQQKLDVAMDRKDPREYGMEHMRWKRVHGNWIQTHTLTENDLNIIVSGLEEIIEQSGDYFDKEDDEIDEDFNIEVDATGKVFRDIPWSVLNKKRLKDLLEYRGDF